jgi:hypothetical protein
VGRDPALVRDHPRYYFRPPHHRGQVSRPPAQFRDQLFAQSVDLIPGLGATRTDVAFRVTSPLNPFPNKLRKQPVPPPFLPEIPSQILRLLPLTS